MAGLDYDVVVIGSGFGGSVAALRLTEKGYRVAVLEAGQRFDDPSRDAPADRHSALPRNSWHTRRYLWAPALRAFGIQRIHLLRGEKGARVLVLAGAGVGGGSLVYANTLYEPPPPFYGDPQWGHITDWRAELAPHYDLAKRMLGVTVNPTMTPADKAVRNVAARMGRAETFRLTPVGVYFGEQPGEQAADPYLRRRGPPPGGLHRVRFVHDRLPFRRQEHADRELSLPGRTRRSAGHPDDHGHRGAAPGRRRLPGGRGHRPAACRAARAR